MPSSAPSEGVIDSVTNFPWWTLILVFGITKFITGPTGHLALRRVAQMLGGHDAQTPVERFHDGEINGEELKMVIAVRMDLQMGKGKIAAQCCHAAVRSYQKLCTPTSDAYWTRVKEAWENGGQRKVVVKVPNEEVLNEVVAAGREAGLLVSTIRDAGRTQIAAGSKTVAAFGPGPESAIDNVTGQLKLL
ncbi:conserved hypothetical protein [Perkinsus marinus ATCC 50983]|uniref:peptidyl-tRNA hydrolase n=1 Tax=Perkinsus marinus (strain ATCC 50983 / TXsc) TaxID=423536 RepID=C5LCG6_PERM5|nr:conserved hypothetical protein [Perkinsus marinus ATCC 50983]EER05649.1 conserved hypothetical protein [Perkinsus marinus ATCC 50983]|eukprot:XP_002773833.1 conserved hypothetical protein [Perkinsus marinus ATCC 50983]